MKQYNKSPWLFAKGKPKYESFNFINEISLGLKAKAKIERVKKNIYNKKEKVLDDIHNKKLEIKRARTFAKAAKAGVFTKGGPKSGPGFRTIKI